MIHFILAFHNHQPVGNFENVFREAFEKCYDPFLTFLEEHPFFRVSLHYSGCLLDWLEGREKRFLKRLERLVRKNQVEMLSGGYYEPILPLIPERDAIHQIRFMNQYLKRRFHKTPFGFWLTERVWESKLPRIAAQAGLRYTTVDDTHFSLAGIPDREIYDFFITEEEDCPLYVFPIPKFLRYAIPFHEPQETLDYLHSLPTQDSEPSVATYADDGEKFGLWPGTYQWVYRDGWLERFALALEKNRSSISLKTFSEVLGQQRTGPVRKAYLPTASYEEMTEWSLSLEKGREFLKLRRELESIGIWNRARDFFQGGIFKNFLVKYPEADWMRSKMKWVSQRVEGTKNPSKRKRAERELWQGQCNCPYWHGIFGGLYLHHLRRSTYDHLIRAEQICAAGTGGKALRLLEKDLNQDGLEETIIESFPFSFYFLSHRGGSLVELDFHPKSTNVLDVLTRREEAYHGEIFQEKRSTGAGKSIHEMEKVVPAGVADRVAFDSYQRLSFLDLFLPLETTLEEFWKGRFRLLGGDPTQVPYEKGWRKEKGGGILSLKGRRVLELQNQKIEVTAWKKFQVRPGENQFQVTWSLINESSAKLDCLWGSEWNFNFYDRERKEEAVRRIEVQDGWSPVHLTLSGEEDFDYWQFPIETLAQSEKDYRLLHQGISIFPHWHFSLAPKQGFERSLIFSFSNGKNQS